MSASTISIRTPRDRPAGSNTAPVLRAGVILLVAMSASLAGPVWVGWNNLEGTSIGPVRRPATGPTAGALAGVSALPMRFVPNAGQAGEGVAFVAAGPGYSVAFASSEVMLAMAPPATVGSSGVALGLRLLGAGEGVRPEGTDPLPGTVSYFAGTDPDGWHAGLPTFGSVLYREVWPGVDAVFRGGTGDLTYEFVIRPGGRVDEIRLDYRGADSVRIDPAGNLIVGTALGPLFDSAPVTYQVVDGIRVPVHSRFDLVGSMGSTAVGFAVDPYDPSRPLILDPVIDFSTFIGGGEPDVGLGVAVDEAGNVYVGGENTDPGFPTTPGAFDPTYNGRDEAWVAKLDPTGSDLLASTYVGGTESEAVFALTIDEDGNVYITGETESDDYPTTPGAYDTTYNGGLDVFVTKLDPSLSSLVYSTLLGGTRGHLPGGSGSGAPSGSPDGSLSPGVPGDHGSDIEVDHRGFVFVAGFTQSNDFPTTPGAYDTTFNGDFDVFVASFDATGSSLRYSTVVGTVDHERAEDIEVDGTGKAFVTGHTQSTNFPVTGGAFDTTANGATDIFVFKLNSAGSSLAYSTYVGGSGIDRGLGMALNASGHAFVTGLTASPNLPVPDGAFDETLGGGDDGFVIELSRTGSVLLAGTYLGGSGDDQGWEMTRDGNGDLLVTGSTGSSDFPTTAGGDPTFNGGTDDAFVVKLDGEESVLLYGTYLGGRDIEVARAIWVDPSGVVYVTGFTSSGDFPTTRGAFDRSHNSKYDVFVTKLDPP